ncbi:MAG: response regulator [Patescibacteria group bacterium]|nr:response regulator [Patescibacteria group bacterium]
MKKKALIVEDDGLLQNVLAKKMEFLGMEVLRANDGQAGYDLILREHPHIVLLDLMLPQMDGFQVLEAIRKYPDQEVAATKVIVLSNLWSAKDILGAKALKIEEYYVKNSADLDEVCRKALACTVQN